MLISRCKKVVLRCKIWCCIILIFLLTVMYSRSKYNVDSYSNKNNSKLTPYDMYKNSPKGFTKMKYILLWTNKNKYPFIYFGEGRSVFVNKKCEWSNCYVTGDRNFLGDYTEFDVVAFNGPQLQSHLDLGDLPERRSNHQKFVYANIESSANYPVCSNTWNGYFNWTWTYKLDSDAIWGYFVIRNRSGTVIGPSKNIQWINAEDMDTINVELISKLKSKKRAAAWFASNCRTVNHREEYVRKVKSHLKKNRLDVDIYGDCGQMQCPKTIMNHCLSLLERNYYFYFAFENANSEDYVTEKIMYALNHNTVPVVLGGANYSRFMPPGSYFNALKLDPEKLALKIAEIIQNSSLYHKFFRWKKYYSFHLRHESPRTDDYCHFCTMINNETLMKTCTVYENFDAWWVNAGYCTFTQGETLISESLLEN